MGFFINEGSSLTNQSPSLTRKRTVSKLSICSYLIKWLTGLRLTIRRNLPAFFGMQKKEQTNPIESFSTSKIAFLAKRLATSALQTACISSEMTSSRGGIHWIGCEMKSILRPFVIVSSTHGSLVTNAQRSEKRCNLAPISSLQIRGVGKTEAFAT